MIEDSLTFLQKFKEIASDKYAKWEAIKNIIAPLLDQGAFSNIAYTPHDYSRHCIGIYRNLDLQINEKEYKEMGGESLFCLACAVLLHDIAMAINPSCRNFHAISGANIVSLGSIQLKLLDDIDYQSAVDCNPKELKDIDIINFALKNYSHAIQQFLSLALDESDAKHIGYIIACHSDIKLRNGKKANMLKIKGFDNIKGVDGRIIDIKLLSALLRFADELDVTNKRIKDIKLELNDLDENSRLHWYKLKLIEEISINGQTVKLHVNENELVRKDPTNLYYVGGGSLDRIFGFIHEVRGKIYDELININKEVFCDRRGFQNYFEKIELEFVQEDYKKQYDDFVQNLTVRKEIIPNKIDVLAEQHINEFIIRNKLFFEGHFNLAGTCLARDYIDTHEIVTNSNMLNEIIKVFYEFFEKYILKENSKDDFFIIGIDLDGMIMASNFCLYHDIGFIYVLPERNDRMFDVHDKSIFEDIGKKNIILFISAIVTGSTVLKVVNELKDKKIINSETNVILFSILDRKPCNALSDKCKKICDLRESNLRAIGIDENKRNFHVISRTFKIELCAKDISDCLQCTYEFNNNHYRS